MKVGFMKHLLTPVPRMIKTQSELNS